MKSASVAFLAKAVRVASLVLVMIVSGCATRTLDEAQFRSLTQRNALGHLYYTGTKGGFHYVAESYFLERTEYYRLPVSTYAITNTFPKTTDRAVWVPWEVNLGSGTEGFRGEQVHTVQK